MCYTLCKWSLVDSPKERFGEVVDCQVRSVCCLVGWRGRPEEGRLAGRPKFCNRDTWKFDKPKETFGILVWTPSDHKIDSFSLWEDGRKDAWVGTDSLKFVDFEGWVEWWVRGLGESDYVLPSHPSLVRGLKLMTLGATLWMVGNRTPRGCADWNKQVWHGRTCGGWQGIRPV